MEKTLDTWAFEIRGHEEESLETLRCLEWSPKLGLPAVFRQRPLPEVRGIGPTFRTFGHSDTKVLARVGRSAGYTFFMFRWPFRRTLRNTGFAMVLIGILSKRLWLPRLKLHNSSILELNADAGCP